MRPELVMVLIISLFMVMLSFTMLLIEARMYFWEHGVAHTKLPSLVYCRYEPLINKTLITIVDPKDYGYVAILINAKTGSRAEMLLKPGNSFNTTYIVDGMYTNGVLLPESAPAQAYPFHCRIPG